MMLQVGDKIRHKHNLGSSDYIVHRVTAKRAFVRYNDVAEGCFAREYNGDEVSQIPKAGRWDTSRWTVIKPSTQERT